MWVRWSLVAMLALTGCASDADGDGYSGDEDCDDADASTYVGAAEVCDGADNDCDGTVDNGASDAVTFYADADADGFGDLASPQSACAAPTGFVQDGTDCDDGNADVSPTSDELCNDVDDDCDGDIDEDGAVDASTYYADSDDDGFGDPAEVRNACDLPDGYIADNTDCDDDNDQINPAADELCNGVDDDCDVDVDEDAVDATAWYADTDEDGLGDPDTEVFACSMPAGASDNADDCDDSDAVVLECCSALPLDGDLVLTASQSLAGGPYWYDRVVVPAGMTLTITGDQPLELQANEVVIDGTIDLSGMDGGDSTPSAVPDGGDAGPGGGGGGGGGDCGNGSGAGGAPNGADGLEDGGSGGLPAGLTGVSLAVGGEFGCGYGGGGGGHWESGGTGLTAFPDCTATGPDGAGGASYGSEDLSAGLFGGAGGGGGGANGGGGGGGGGAISIFANTIEVDGLVDVTGGDGGGKTGGSCGSGGGGAGAGGTIWLHADSLVVSGVLDASPGEVAPLDSAARLDGLGGSGAAGRVRMSAVRRDITGTVLTGSTFQDDSRATCDAS